MTKRRKLLSAAAGCVLAAGGAAAWALAPAPSTARTPAIAAPETVPLDPWAKGPVDRDYMVKGVLDYRSDAAQR
jgi:hypothetical protein